MAVNIESMVYELCKDGKCKLMSAHQISHKLNLNKFYGTKGKQLVGMAIARLRKKNKYIEYRQ